MAERFYVGTRKGLFTVGRSGSGKSPWRIERAAFLGDPVPMLLPERGGERVLAALDHGHFGSKMHRSTDGGDTWAEVAVPTYPEKPEGEEDVDKFKGQPPPWALKLVWALEQGTPDQAGRLWCGTIPGGLFRSDDGGDSWDIVRSLWDHPDRKEHWFGGGADWPGIHSVVVDPRDGDHVTCGVSCGGVWVTRDGGETWGQSAHGMRAAYMPPEKALEPDSQDPHCIRPCAAEPDVMWCQHHNGIFRSTSGGTKWTEIEEAGPSTFGFAVAAHPTDPRTAWFVPAVKDEKRYPHDGRVVVTRTRDGGESFDVLTQGLPQEHAYDLVYRHALAIDETGERLAFGSTTGNLWVTEDGGDSFQQLATSLPPIYCVRFSS